ncbi:MAG: hypothetical protein J6B85_08420 [Lachnospiraceae bacterium]|nr:hypothetical protein [Lachnospiraceae bacterium]
MREFTSASANKLLRTYEDEKNYLLSMEADSATYVLADGEKEEPPAYSYEETAARLAQIDREVRKLKHAINVFNVGAVLPKLGITIDEALVKMAQLTRTRARLDSMRKRLPKARKQEYGRTNLIEYEYVNYDLQKVQEDYQKVCQEIMEIQMELDYCNQTVTFEVDL